MGCRLQGGRDEGMKGVGGTDGQTYGLTLSSSCSETISACWGPWHWLGSALYWQPSQPTLVTLESWETTKWNLCILSLSNLGIQIFHIPILTFSLAGSMPFMTGLSLMNFISLLAGCSPMSWLHHHEVGSSPRYSRWPQTISHFLHSNLIN